MIGAGSVKRRATNHVSNAWELWASKTTKRDVRDAESISRRCLAKLLVEEDARGRRLDV